jgi:hypothetical protein
MPEASVEKTKEKEKQKTRDEEKLELCLKMIDFERPRRIREMASRLVRLYGDVRSVGITSPDGMYPEVHEDFVELEGMAQLLNNGWVDISIIHWCEM